MGAEGATKEGVLVYGATGVTGRLVAQRAREVGLTVTLAGRSAQKLEAVADELKLPVEAFELTQTDRLRSVVARHQLVLHIAGPYAVTALPMLDACIEQGTHYVDVTAELKVLELAKSLDGKARAKNVTLMPATGFDVVPGDCLAVYLKNKLPTATRLDLGTFIPLPRKGVKYDLSLSSGVVSHGTAVSLALHIASGGGMVWRDGKFQRQPIGRLSKVFTLTDTSATHVSPLHTMSFPAAELSATAFSTSIPNITVYAPGNGGWSLASIAASVLSTASRVWPFRPALEAALRRLPTPQITLDVERELQKLPQTMCVGEAVDEASGKTVSAFVAVAPGYTFTAYSCVEIARRILSGDFKPGFQTPGSAYDYDLVTSIPQCAGRIEDIPTPG